MPHPIILGCLTQIDTISPHIFCLLGSDFSLNKSRPQFITVYWTYKIK